jgi:hypothetical protein
MLATTNLRVIFNMIQNLRTHLRRADNIGGSRNDKQYWTLHSPLNYNVVGTKQLKTLVDQKKTDDCRSP